MRSSGFDPASVEIFNRRLKIVSLFVIVVFIVLVLRLWFIQIMNGPSYRIQSENNRIHLQDILPSRGMILDRTGELLVNNRPSYDLYIVPEDIQNREELLARLSKLIALDSVLTEAKLKKASKRYPFRSILIKKNISRNELAVIETNLFNLAGVLIQVRPHRNYIFNQFASHVIGYLGEISERQLNSDTYTGNRPGDFIGKYGVEGRWQKWLNGTRGGAQVEVDAAGRKLRVISKKLPIPGANIFLSIDKNLQLLAEKRLVGKKGAVVAMNPNNGEILALASSPPFDPGLFVGGFDQATWNRIVSSKESPLLDRAIAGEYPPGSVFKIVVALAGLETGIIDPEEEIICKGSYRLGNRTYRDWKKGGHGVVDLHKALVESCDVYFYKMGNRIGIDEIAKYANMLGLGKATGYDIGREKAGLVPTRQWKKEKKGIPWQAGETIVVAIGQSFLLVTPLQVANMISAVFNGGFLYQPKVIKAVVKGEEEIFTFVSTQKRRIDVKPENLELIQKALIGVVQEQRGTGRKAQVKGITVAGKTGTAQVVNMAPDKDPEDINKIPMALRDHAWFTALASTGKPELAIAIIIENGGHGGSTSAPIARELIEAYLGNGDTAK